MNRKWNKFSEKLPDKEHVFISDGERVWVGSAEPFESREKIMRWWKVHYANTWPDDFWASLRLPNPPKKV